MTSLLLLAACALAPANVTDAHVRPFDPVSAPMATVSSPSRLRRWDAVGHRAMAAMAYDLLRPTTRAVVDSLLRQHPDLAQLSQGIDVSTAAGVRDLFTRASVWPDRIRGDARFYRETDPTAEPTPLLPGFPTMARRDGWHYLTRSFSTDGTPTIPLEAPNIATVLPSMADAMADPATPASVRAYNLSWIIHVVGDLHQPVHGTSRSTADAPNGDAGANRVWIHIPANPRDSINLHAVWDGMVGRVSRDLPIDSIAVDLAEALPQPSSRSDALHIPDGAALAETVKQWADESATLAQYVVYDLPARVDGAPPRVDQGYMDRGERIARHRLALSAYRLAALLEARLGKE